MAHIMPLLLQLCCDYLSTSDLASLARVSHQLNDLVTARLYRTIRFHCPGRIASEDPILRKLDIFGDPRFPSLLHTWRVYVTGSWYDTYDEIESELGQHQVLSPAARMFSNIISSCIVRMPHLKEFIWDLQISPTQLLVTSIMLRPSLETLQLRLGTDGTPKPYFRPLFEFHEPVNIRKMRFTQVDNESVLETIGLAMSKAIDLQELSIWADEDSRLTLDPVFDSWQGECSSKLTSLDIRGFDGLGLAPQSLWDRLSPFNLRELTLQLGGDIRSTKCIKFWEQSIKAGLRPVRLSTNLVTPGLKEFIASFSGLELLNILPSDGPRPGEPLPPLMQTLREQHSTTLKALAISPQGDLADYTLDTSTVTRLSADFPEIEELRFGLPQLNAQATHAALSCSKLRVLHVLYGDQVEAANKQILQACILQFLNEGLASGLKYIAFDDDPVYEILTTPVRRVQRRSLIGYIKDTMLLNEKMFSWLGNA